MLKIAVCEDTVLDLQQLERQLETYAAQHPELAVSQTSFQSSEELLPRIRKGAFDIYLLDIIMNGKDGVAIGNAIRNVDEETVIIYTTVSPDYAIVCYNVAAFYYLVKPFEDQRLFTVLDRAVKRFPLKPDGDLSIRTVDDTKTIHKSAIVYIEYHSHCLSYHLEDQTSITSLSFRESFDQVTEPILESRLFQKISSSYIVNLAQVDRITKRGFLMKDGVEVTVSRRYSDAKKTFVKITSKRGETYDF